MNLSCLLQFQRKLNIFQLTFCLSRIFIAQWVLFPLCCTSITLPKLPVPNVFILSKSSRLAVFYKDKNYVSNLEYSSNLKKNSVRKKRERFFQMILHYVDDISHQEGKVCMSKQQTNHQAKPQESFFIPKTRNKLLPSFCIEPTYFWIF